MFKGRKSRFKGSRTTEAAPKVVPYFTPDVRTTVWNDDPEVARLAAQEAQAAKAVKAVAISNTVGYDYF